MPTNVLLVRWKGGWHEMVEVQSANTYFRQEAFLSLGALQDIHEVERVTALQLSVVAWPRDAIAVDHDPISRADRPYRSYNVGDTIVVPQFGTGTTHQRVRALTGSEDDEGNVTYAPELGDLLLEEGERTLQAVKKMIDGTLGGESPVAQPAPATYPIVAQSIPKPKKGELFLLADFEDNAAYTETYVLSSIGGSGGSASLVSLKLTPHGADPGTGPAGIVEVYQMLGGSETLVARVELPRPWTADVTYTGEFFAGTATFTPGDDGLFLRLPSAWPTTEGFSLELKGQFSASATEYFTWIGGG